MILAMSPDDSLVIRKVGLGARHGIWVLRLQAVSLCQVEHLLVRLG